MQSGKILILVAIAIALFAVLQIAESKTVSEEAKAIEKHVDEEFKKLSKRAAEDEEEGAKHRKSKKRRGGSTTGAPAEPKSTTAAPAADSKSTTQTPDGQSTTGGPSTTKRSGGTSTPTPKGSNTTKKADLASTDNKEVEKAVKAQSEERAIIRKIFSELFNWKAWLLKHERKTLNPRAAKATLDLGDKVKKIIFEKPRRFYGKFNSNGADW